MKRRCELCRGLGSRSSGFKLGYRRCENCDGAGEVVMDETWRPYEQSLENEYWARMERMYGSCLR